MLLLTACQLVEDVTPTPQATPSPQATLPSSTPADPGEAAPPPALQSLRLVVWTIPEITPGADVAGGEELAAQLEAFDNNNPTLELDISVKATSGAASSLNYLRTAQNVAPAILPDVLIMPARQLAAAVDAGLVYPIAAAGAVAGSSGPVTQAMIDDLIPAAALLGRLGDPNGPLMGYPLALDGVLHLAFDTERVNEPPGATWDVFAASGDRLVLAGDGDDGALLLLQYYLDAGGRLTTDAGQPLLELAPLQTALTRLETGRRSGAIAIDSASNRSTAEAWQSYLSGVAAVVLVDADFFVAQRAQGDDSAYAPVPGRAAALTPLVDGWVWVIATADITRQQRAAELLAWLIEPANLAAWSLAGHFVPARRSALAAWPAEDPYLAFLQGELARARAFPVTTSDALLEALAIAAGDVLSLAQSPAAAAQQAVNSLNP